MLADLIGADTYPKVELEDEASLIALSYSEVDGWEYHFEITADGPAFSKFKKTGHLDTRSVPWL
jgi:hypothetical protein